MSELKVSSYTSEAGHWYTRKGEPMYQIEGANGKIRNTTLRDARKHDLVPSVTTVLNVAAKPGLEKWKLQQVLFAALTLPKRDQESETDYLDRILDDSREQAKAAADVGTQIHAAIQNFYEDKSGYPYANYVGPIDAKICQNFGQQKWICEQSFAHESGYGGKVDMYAASIDDPKAGIILDVKTKEFFDPDKVEAYDDHLMQLAAYRMGLGMTDARCANVFVSRGIPGMVKIIEWSPEDLNRGWQMFSNLLGFWQLKNSHK